MILKRADPRLEEAKNKRLKREPTHDLPGAHAGSGGRYVSGHFRKAPAMPGLATPPVNGANTRGWIRYQNELEAPSGVPPAAMFKPTPANKRHPAVHRGLPGFNTFRPPHLPDTPYGAYPTRQTLPVSNITMSVTRWSPAMAAVPPKAPVIAAHPQAVPDAKLDINDLFRKLVHAGMIGSGEKSKRTTAIDVEPKELVREQIPRLSFKRTDLWTKRNNGVISALHQGVQCATCGQRFTEAEKNSDKYAQHLDWHFRSARRAREGMKKAPSREWYYEISDWIQYAEFEDVDDRARSYSGIQETQHDHGHRRTSQDSIPTDGQKPPTVSAKSANRSGNSCFLCHEAFELFYCEESEEWQLRNAMMYEEKVLHPDCYEDFIRPAPEPVVPKEEPESLVVEGVPIRTESDEPKSGAVYDDESSQPLPCLDFLPAPAPLKSRWRSSDWNQRQPSQGEAFL